MERLSKDEIARSERFRTPDDRNRFVVARHLLRTMIGQATHLAPESLSFVVENGKPRLDDVEGLAFSLSHSGDYVIAAAANARAVGVDVQEHRDGLNLLAMSARVFTTAEQAVFAEKAPSCRAAAFFRLWTRKEAYLKARGTGLVTDPATVEIAFDRDMDAAFAVHDPGDEAGRSKGNAWMLWDVPVAPAYSAALALWR